MNPEVYREKIDELYQSYNNKKNTSDLERSEYHSIMNLYINEYHRNNKKKCSKKF
jgi:hypothetical protein